MDKEPQPLNDDGQDWEFPSGKELGALLRAKREEMGLTYAQVSEKIKVKAGYLKALEDEAWDDLPSPAFIKGFIRSYARVLGLSEEGLIALYRETTPPPQPMPRPLQATPQKNRVPLYIILFVAILAGGVAAYHWMETSSFMERPAKVGTTPSADERSDKAIAEQDHRVEKKDTPLGEVRETAAPVDTERELSPQVPAPVSGPEQAGVIDQPTESPRQAEKGASPEAGKPTGAEPSVPDTAQALETDRPPLVLKALVKERTWVRVTVDDQKPKEYTLDLQNSPEWRAHKGFELLIGNAGGIELEFNGQRIENLGKPGQVIKLRLPAGDERSISAE